jgi:predicted lysophospholipase L1 biosynthesis ABC-type transport system permease subunit
MVATFAVATALILLSASIPSATRARAERERNIIPRVKSGADRPASYSLVMYLPGDFFGHQMTLEAMAAVGKDPPVPPGLDRVPVPGHVALSPALADLLNSPSGHLLAPRVPGRVTDIIGKEGLPAADSLVGYVGLRQAALIRPEVVVGYGLRRGDDGQPISLGVWVAVVVLVLAVLAPIATVLGAATRLSSRTREARLAALRLVGGTPALVRASASIEAGFLALAGAGIGVPAYLYGRSLVSQRFPDPYRWFPEDLQVGTAWVIVVLLVVTSFAVGVSLLSMRRVVLTPLGVVRRSPVLRQRPVGLWFMAGGILLLVLAPVLARLSLKDLAMIDLALGLALTVMGIIVALPWLVRRAAGRLARRVRRPALLLGMHALSGDPGNLGRTAAAVAVIVLLGAVGQAIVLASALGDTRDVQRAEREPDVVFVSVVGPREQARRTLERVEGVLSVEERPTDLWGGRGQPHNFAARTDGGRQTEEKIKNALAFETRISDVGSAASLRQRHLGTWNSIRGIAEGTVATALLVVWMSLMVATIDRTVEQRRAMAGLAAIGARTSVLRGSVAAQAVVPLGLSVGLGWLLSVPITTLLFSAIRARVLFPIRFSLLLIAVLVGLTIVSSALTIPWVRGVAGPASLRSE